MFSQHASKKGTLLYSGTWKCYSLNSELGKCQCAQEDKPSIPCLISMAENGREKHSAIKKE